MSTHDEYMTRRQARDLARRLARLERKTRSTAAANDLPHSSIDDGVLKLKENGRTVYQLGTDPATGVTAPQYRGGPTPEPPSAPFVDVGGEVVKIQHSGLDVNEDPAPADFRRAQIHASQDAVFEPSLSTLAGYLEEADGSFTHRLPGGEWYVGIVWETLSGKTSVMSEVVLADIPPLVDTQDLEDTLAAAEEKLNTYRDEVVTPRFQALEEGLSENSDTLADARDRLAEAEQTLSPLPGRIESAERDVVAAQEEATKAAAAAVEANNRAMTRLANGNFESGLDYWSRSNVSLSSTAHSGRQAAQVGGWLRPESSFPVVPDQIWELSLYHQYDVSVEFQAVDGDKRTTLSTHHLDGDSTWSDSGALRVTIPDGVDMLSFTITGIGGIVDDITLRDVTDVVRLEEAANANRRKAELAIGELEMMYLVVEGPGGLRGRIDSAEDDLENIDTELDQVATNLTTALTGPITHDRLRSGTGAFDQGFIGELWAGNIRALAAELASLIVASPNMIPNGDLTQGDDFWTVSNAQLVTDDTPPGYEHAIRRAPNDGPVRHNVRFPVQGGKEYLWEMWIKADKPNSRFFWDMRDQSGTHVGSTGGSTKALEPAGHNPGVRPVSSLIVPTEWTLVRTVLRPSQNVTHLYMASMYFNHSAGTERDATISIGGVRMTPRAGAEVLVDGSVTAEKITATREMITKIMGAEWAYIAQKLIVDGKILTRDLEALSAAIQSLTVTQRADIAKLWAQEIWTALAVVENLQAEKAWITSAMVSELTAEKVTVTRNFVARVAEFADVFADKLWANRAFIDRMAASEAYFGSENADQQTRVDGTGVTLYRKTDGENIPAAAFGGGDLRLSFFDDAGNSTGAVTRDGHVSGVEANFQNYVWQGRQFFGRSLQEENIPVLDSLTHKFVARNRRVMGASDGANQENYGFLPLTFHAVAGMTYEIIVPSIRMWNISEAPIVSAQIHYTTDGRPPVLSDPVLGGETVATTANVGSQKIIQHFSRFFDCEEDCEVNLLLAVRTENGAKVSRWWHAASTGASTVRMLVRPAGATPPITGGTRDVTLGNPDVRGGEHFYYTGWAPTWHQAYRNADRYRGTSKHMLSGTDGPGVRYSTHFGGYRTSPGYAGSTGEPGRTMGQALDGAFIANGTLTLTGAANPTSSGGHVWVQWHTHTSAPARFTSEYNTRLIQSVVVTAGQQTTIDLPREVLDAIQAGTLQGFTVHHPTADIPYVSIRSAESTDLITNQPIMRLGYIR